MFEEYSEDLYGELEDACCDGQFDIVVNLVENRGCSPNGLSYRHKPLGLACAFGHLEIAKFLLEKGADVNAVDLNDDSALGLSVIYHGTPEVIRFLLDNGANVYHLSKTGQLTILDYAIERQSDEIVNILREHMSVPQGA